jgi:hypothetical protein
VLITTTSLGLRPSTAATLAMRLAATAAHLRPRRALLLMWRSLLTRRRLRTRGRLTTTTTATIELASGRLRRTRPLSRRHVVHLPLLRSTLGSGASIGLRRTLVVSHIYVRLLGVPTARSTARLRAAGSRRTVVMATRKGVRLPAARFTPARAPAIRFGARSSAMRLTASARRPVIPPRHLRRGLATASSTTVQIATARSATWPVIANRRRAVTFHAASAARPIIARRR